MRIIGKSMPIASIVCRKICQSSPACGLRQKRFNFRRRMANPRQRRKLLPVYRLACLPPLFLLKMPGHARQRKRLAPLSDDSRTTAPQLRRRLLMCNFRDIFAIHRRLRHAKTHDGGHHEKRRKPTSRLNPFYAQAAPVLKMLVSARPRFPSAAAQADLLDWFKGHDRPPAPAGKALSLLNPPSGRLIDAYPRR